MLLRSSTTNADAALDGCRRSSRRSCCPRSAKVNAAEPRTKRRADRDADARPGAVPLRPEAAAGRRHVTRRDRVVARADCAALPRVMNDNGEMSAAACRAPHRCTFSPRSPRGCTGSCSAMQVAPRSAVLIAGMVGACLYCACELWSSGTTRAWCLVAVMNLAMVAVHLPMSGAHHITHAAVKAVVPQSMIMTSATVLSMVEVLIAVAVLVLPHAWQRESGRPTGISRRRSAAE